jgi:hypothetical protein
VTSGLPFCGKTEELEGKARADRLATPGGWFSAMGARLSESTCSAADVDLANVLRDLASLSHSHQTDHLPVACDHD